MAGGFLKVCLVLCLMIYSSFIKIDDIFYDGFVSFLGGWVSCDYYLAMQYLYKFSFDAMSV